MRSYAARATFFALLAILLAGAPAPAQSFPDSTSRTSSPALDVPYISQGVLLCGGAALAMVERFWGRRGVFADDFASLVHRDLGGIITNELATAARERGWDTRTFDGTPELVQQSLAAGVPVIALIQVGRKRYHYVVVLQWAAGRVVYHDPARTPSRSVAEENFLAQWSGADRWAMVIKPATRPAGNAVPAPGVPTAISPSATMTVDSTTCRSMIDRAIEAAASGRLGDAADLLNDAAKPCPASVVINRELAGVRFKQRRYAEAARLANQYARQEADDTLGWQLLASSLFLAGNADGALDAWNHVGRPTVDLIRIDGVHSTRFRTLVDAMRLPPRSMLTRWRLRMARRRLADMPSIGLSAVKFQPVGDGLAEVQAAVIERPTFGRPLLLLGRSAINALVQKQVYLDVANIFGVGDSWNAVYRWQEPRPHAALHADLPVTTWQPMVVGVETAWDRYRFAPTTPALDVYEESRRSTTLTIGGWLTPFMRAMYGARQERWSASRNYLVTLSTIEFRTTHDRLNVQLSADHGFATNPTQSYSHGSARLAWASSLGLATTVWSSRLGIDASTQSAPIGTWASAGSNFAYAFGLRAHPGVIGDALDPATVGRVLMHGGVAGDKPFYHTGALVFAAGLFVDGARVTDPATGLPTSKLYLDAGGGLRVGIANGRLGVIRLDLATGLTDKSTAVTVGLHQTWPLVR